MTSRVVHFLPDDDDVTACGAKVFLCEEFTENPQHVECGNCKRTKRFKDYDPRRFDVTIWDWEGNELNYHPNVGIEKVEAIQAEHRESPELSVVVAQR
jgi:tRNA(Ile2) C34 agmatinyltransferase TiaS